MPKYIFAVHYLSDKFYDAYKSIQKVIFDVYWDGILLTYEEYYKWNEELFEIFNDRRWAEVPEEKNEVNCSEVSTECKDVLTEKAEAEFERVKNDDAKLFENEDENLTFYYGYFTALSDFGIITADRCDEMTEELTALFYVDSGNAPAGQELHI